MNPQARSSSRSSAARSRTQHRARGFTLLEMLVVMVIIGLLAGLVGPRIFGKVDSSKVKTAQTQIKMLESAVQIMRLDVGRIPAGDQALQWLASPPTDDETAKSLWKGPYIEGKIPVDPWNTPYAIKVPGNDGKPVSIISLGADGKPGGEGLDADIGEH
ncbi:type II secretion system major pseudopilin GspG [Variovorax sp. J22P271]|uniref:type II secretion system major pseudopilin GspG n=1 Tax=Variovorax davisae TaxID=3053515 RepID=UPI00257715A3|nr:type II secretion system major pseudopilin GspG [Variovorax sp. J22P271]MDM0033336.1 type II secretion system major pseudopilin GspG [Variovorax sp. J22P271]